MSRNVILDLIGLLTGTILSAVLNKRGHRLAASITLAASIVLAFFALRSAIKDFFEFGVRHYTETAVVLTVLTAALFWLYGVDQAKPGAGQMPAPQQPRGWSTFLTGVISETGAQLNSVLERQRRLTTALTMLSLVLLIVPLSLSLWTLFAPAPEESAAPSPAGGAPLATAPGAKNVSDDAEAARQKQIEDNRKKTEEIERQRKAEAERIAAEAAQKQKAEDDETARQREAERRRQEYLRWLVQEAEAKADRERAQQAEAQARADQERARQGEAEARADRERAKAEAEARTDRERQKRLATGPKSIDPPATTTLNGFRLLPGTFMWGVEPPNDRRMSYTVRNVQECSTICQRNATCVGFTYEGVSCFVFGRITETRSSANYTSGRR